MKSSLQLGAAALVGAAVAYLLMKRAPAPQLRMRIPSCAQLSHWFGGFAGQWASPGLDA